MSVNTKLYLNNNKFGQCSTDVLNLSGCTLIIGQLKIMSGGTLSILPNHGSGKIATSDSNGNITLQNSSGGSSICSTNNEIIFNKNNVITGNTNLLYCSSIDGLQIGLGSCAFAQHSVGIAGASSNGCNSVAMIGSAGSYGIYSFAAIDSLTYGVCSIAMGNATTCCCNSLAMIGGTACGICSVAMINGMTCNCNSIAIGFNNIVRSKNSVIIGGCNNVISSGNTTSGIIGGNNINATGNTYLNTVIVPNLAIWNVEAGSGNVLCRNPLTKKIELTSGSSGGTSICSSNTEIIFNNSGTLTGNTNLKYCKSIDALQVNSGSCAQGQGSIAMGSGQAYGINSFAVGFDINNTSFSIACGISSVAMNGGQAFGDNSVAMGLSCAYGQYSVAMGVSIANSFNSVAMIGGTTCDINSFAMGYGSITSGNTSVAIIGGITMGSNTFALGSNSIACSQNSIAMGGGITVSGDGSIAIGVNSLTYACNSIAMAGGVACGDYSVAMVGGQAMYMQSVAMVNGETHAMSSVAMAGGLACGTNSVAMAGGNTFGQNSVAMAGGNACGQNSMGITLNSTAIGTNSVAMTCGIACGVGSVAINGSTTCGDCSFSVGIGNVTKSINGVIIGGHDNLLCSGNINSVIIGGSGYTMSINAYCNTVAVPNLIVWNKNIEVTTNLCGVILRSTSGCRYKITVSDIGVLSTTLI